MDLALSDDDEALVASFDALLARYAGPAAVRRVQPLGFDRDLWRRVGAAGVPSMAVDGASLLQLAFVAERAGVHLAPVPIVEALAAARADDTRVDERIATLALAPPREGILRLVPAGAIAEVIVALDGDELVRIEAPAPGAGPRNLGDLPLADRRLDEGVRTVLATGSAAQARYEAALARWKVLTAAALTGLAAEALRLGAEYAKHRYAFGAPIAKFQTVAHTLADRATAVDGARLLVYEAAWAADAVPERAEALASMAFLYAGETALDTARDALHFHGGYGFTAEFDIQLYFRRAKAWALQLGDPAIERRRLARRLFVEVPG